MFEDISSKSKMSELGLDEEVEPTSTTSCPTHQAAESANLFAGECRGSPGCPRIVSPVFQTILPRNAFVVRVASLLKNAEDLHAASKETPKYIKRKIEGDKERGDGAVGVLEVSHMPHVA